jgi:hypothetical protein
MDDQNVIYADDIEPTSRSNSRNDSDTILFQQTDDEINEASIKGIIEKPTSPAMEATIIKEIGKKPLMEMTKKVEEIYTYDARLESEKRAQELVAEKLAEQGTSEYETYKVFLDAISDEVDALRKMFEQIQTKRRLCLLVDCSSSMVRLDPEDHRLSRCMEIAALIMETCWGMEKKWTYSIVGHSGESSNITIVPYGDPPINGTERFRALQKMIAQAQFCRGGDNTLNALVDVGSSGKYDLVIVISDAYLEEHDVDANTIIRALRQCSSRSSTKVYFVFLAGLISEAIDIIEKLPKDRAFACTASSDMPSILQLILENLDPTFPKQKDVRENIVDLIALREKAKKQFQK